MESSKTQILDNLINREVLSKLYPSDSIEIADIQQIVPNQLRVHPDSYQHWEEVVKGYSYGTIFSIHAYPILVHTPTGEIVSFLKGTLPVYLRVKQLTEANYPELGLLKDLVNEGGIYASTKDFGNHWYFCYGFGEQHLALLSDPHI